MIESSLTRLWLLRLGFAALALAILFVDLLPLQTVARNWAAPDFLLCIAFTWSVRRPDYAPLGLLAILFLLADLLLQRPPGLYAALSIVACAHLQSKGPSLRTNGFAREWLRIGALLLAIAIGARVILAIMLIPAPSLWLTLMQVLATMIAYPIVVFACAALFGIRQGAPGELDSYGSRA